jgi:hypothetical protein
MSTHTYSIQFVNLYRDRAPQVSTSRRTLSRPASNAHPVNIRPQRQKPAAQAQAAWLGVTVGREVPALCRPLAACVWQGGTRLRRDRCYTLYSYTIFCTHTLYTIHRTHYTGALCLVPVWLHLRFTCEQVCAACTGRAHAAHTRHGK